MKRTRRLNRIRRKSRKVGGNSSVIRALRNEDIYSFEDALRADPEAANMSYDKDDTILMYTIKQNLIDFMEVLIRYGADVNLRSSTGFTPLFVAIRKDNVEAVSLLLAAGADPNLPTTDYIGEVHPLRWAIFSESMKSLEIIRLLVGAGADINRDELFAYDKSAYMKRNKDVAKAKVALLYDLGLDINKGDQWGTLLRNCLRDYPEYDNEFIQYLLSRGANTLEHNNSNPLLIQILEELVDVDFKPVGANKDEFISFIIPAVLATLPESELRKRSPTGQTAYMTALRVGIPESYLELIKTRTGGQNTNKNIYGTTAARYRNLRPQQTARNPPTTH